MNNEVAKLLIKLFDIVKSKAHFKVASGFHDAKRFDNKMEDGTKGQHMQTKACTPEHL